MTTITICETPKPKTVRLSNGKAVALRVVTDLLEAADEMIAENQPLLVASLRRRFVALSEPEIVEILQACEVAIPVRKAPAMAKVYAFPQAA